MSSFLKISLGVIALLVGCDPVWTPVEGDCEPLADLMFIEPHKLEFELDLSVDKSQSKSFKLSNDACREVRFNYLTNVYGADAAAYTVKTPTQGYEPWIESQDIIEVNVDFEPEAAGHYEDAWIQIRYSYQTNTDVGTIKDTGTLNKIFLTGVAFVSEIDD